MLCKIPPLIFGVYFVLHACYAQNIMKYMLLEQPIIFSSIGIVMIMTWEKFRDQKKCLSRGILKLKNFKHRTVLAPKPPQNHYRAHPPVRTAWDTLLEGGYPGPHASCGGGGMVNFDHDLSTAGLERLWRFLWRVESFKIMLAESIPCVCRHNSVWK